MSVSPSAKKVDDFLSNISAISQQRLRDNHKIQRELDSLRGSSYRPDGVHGVRSTDLGISELRFNRSKRSQFYEEWKNKETTPPPMPARPEPAQSRPSNSENIFLGSEKGPYKPENTSLKSEKPPSKPTKPANLGSASVDAPKLPKRPEERENAPVLPKRPQYTVNLNVPVARKVTDKPEIPKKVEKTINPKVFQPNLPNTKVSERVSQLVPEKHPEEGPEKSQTKGKIQSFLEMENEIKKGENPVLFSDVKDPITKSEKQEPVKPPKPPKFQNKESEMLYEKIRSLSPTKKRPEIPAKTPQKPPVELKSAVHGLKTTSTTFKAAPLKPSKPQALAVEHEALLALEKLKKPVAVQQKKPSIPEAMLKLQSIKQKPSHLKSPGKGEPEQKQKIEEKEQKIKENFQKGKEFNQGKESKEDQKMNLQETKRDDLKQDSPKLDFQSQLANVLRAQTVPSLGTEAPKEIRRSRTTPETTTSGGKLTHPNKSRAKGPRRKLPKSAGESPPKTASTDVEKPKKVPPPKAKKPTFDLQSRFNSEVFI